MNIFTAKNPDSLEGAGEISENDEEEYLEPAKTDYNLESVKIDDNSLIIHYNKKIYKTEIKTDIVINDKLRPFLKPYLKLIENDLVDINGKIQYKNGELELNFTLEAMGVIKEDIKLKLEEFIPLTEEQRKIKELEKRLESQEKDFKFLSQRLNDIKEENIMMIQEKFKYVPKTVILIDERRDEKNSEKNKYLHLEIFEKFIRVIGKNLNEKGIDISKYYVNSAPIYLGEINVYSNRCLKPYKCIIENGIISVKNINIIGNIDLTIPSI